MAEHLRRGSSVKSGRRATREASVAAAVALSLAAVLAIAAPAAAAAPSITTVLPARGPVGTPVVITGQGFGAAAATSKVTFNGVEATPITWQDTFIAVTVPEGAATGPVAVTVGSSQSNLVTFTVMETPLPPASQTWYMTEGSTAWGYETFILIENPGDVTATVNVVYNTQQFGPIPRVVPVTVPPSSRVTLRVNDDIPNVDVSTALTSDRPIVCERAVYWNNRIEGTDSIGVTEPAATWYLAEGSTLNTFDTWVLIENPQLVPAIINMTYMTSNGVVEKAPFSLGAGQRASVQVLKDVGMCDVSTLVESTLPVTCERAMYWDNLRGGHDSIGVTEGSKKWFLAEGSTAWGFQTWLLLQNPDDHAATVHVSYLTSEGPVDEPVFTMPARSRRTILVNERVDNMDTSIAVSSDREIIAERAMYWDNGTGKAGSDTIGMTAPAKDIFLAEGSTAWGFDTYLCIQNPADEPAEVSVIYMTNSGAVAGPPRLVPARSRVTVHVNEDIPNRDVSIKVISATPVMAERAMYWHARGGGHVSIGMEE